jgi:CubicO group peptidase (beta-lactamase class C family)
MKTTNELHDKLQKLAGNDEFSGTVLISKQGEKIFEHAYGYANLAWKIKNNIDTRFDTASVTKIFTTIAILQLIEKELLSFDTRVADVIALSGTKITPDVNIYQLLTHSSGIADDAEEEAGEDYEDLWKEKPNYSVTKTADFLPQFAYKEPNFKPGEGCRYCNCGFVLMGLVLEKVTDTTYRKYVRENIFKKIGMNHTDFLHMDEVNDNVAEGYAPIKDDSKQIIGWRKNIYSFPPVGSPDSGALTTVGDMDIFMRAILDEKLIGRELTADLMAPKVFYKESEKFITKNGYGFEFRYAKSDKLICLQKSGVNTGVCAWFAYYPTQDVNLITFANYDDTLWPVLKDMEEVILSL